MFHDTPVFQYLEHVTPLEHGSSDLVEGVVRALRAHGLDVAWEPPVGDDAHVDGLLHVRWEGGEHVFPATVKPTVRPAEVQLADRPPEDSVLLTRHVTSSMAEVLESSGWRGYADESGNVSLGAPGLLIRVNGQAPRRPPHPPSTAPFTRTGLPVTFAVLVAHDRGGRWTQRDLARLAGTGSLGTVNRVLKALQDSGYRDPEGQLRRPSQLRDQWIAAYVTRQPESWPSQRYTSARWTSAEDVLDVTLPSGALIGSELAAVRLGAPIRPTTAVVYCPPDKRSELVVSGRLRRDPAGTIIVRPAFWSPELTRGARTVPPFLVRADLLLEDDPRLTEIARTWKQSWNDWICA